MLETEDAPIFPEVWKQIESKIAGLPLVANNKAFDESCLKAVFHIYWMDYPDNPSYCTCVALRRVWHKATTPLMLLQPVAAMNCQITIMPWQMQKPAPPSHYK